MLTELSFIYFLFRFPLKTLNGCMVWATQNKLISWMRIFVQLFQQMKEFPSRFPQFVSLYNPPVLRHNFLRNLHIVLTMTPSSINSIKSFLRDVILEFNLRICDCPPLPRLIKLFSACVVVCARLTLHSPHHLADIWQFHILIVFVC